MSTPSCSGAGSVITRYFIGFPRSRLLVLTRLVFQRVGGAILVLGGVAELLDALAKGGKAQAGGWRRK